MPTLEVAPGVYVHVAPHEDFTPANRGGIANLAVIVGAERALVVDTGGSRAEGLAWRATIARLTDRPIAFVVNTHLHPDHILGNAAFVGAPTEFVGHARLPAAMRARGPAYLRSMATLLGPVGAGSELVPPSLLVAAGDTMMLDLGGREVEVTAWPTAHTDTDVTVFDRATQTLIAGDLVFAGRLPVIDGSIKGWLAVLDKLVQREVVRVVPGHGPAALPLAAALPPQRDYLAGLASQIRAVLAKALPLDEAVEAVPAPTGGWALAADNHPRNVIAAYKELEWD